VESPIKRKMRGSIVNFKSPFKNQHEFKGTYIAFIHILVTRTDTDGQFGMGT
jgi:hypothetical protein